MKFHARSTLYNTLSTEPAPFPLRKGSTNISSRCLPSGFQPIPTFCRSALALMVLRSFLWVFGIATCAISHVRVPEVSKCLYWPLCPLSRPCAIPAYLCVLKFYGDRENEYTGAYLFSPRIQRKFQNLFKKI